MATRKTRKLPDPLADVTRLMSRYVAEHQPLGDYLDSHRHHPPMRRRDGLTSENPPDSILTAIASPACLWSAGVTPATTQVFYTRTDNTMLEISLCQHMPSDRRRDEFGPDLRQPDAG
ncbi:hypothetical protein NWFMUON74_71850 (plasmid) [Nocardia wallacei]|uniref:Uncharacterized protein n=1 Tax=Nocardia wallacei TaxID=480035 RepID=A0A7G1KYT4_9NOCA|nr:hypothetical protein NWFMUON74_71850 [Nocardia wallacei]